MPKLADGNADHAPNPVDVHVGGRVRARRKALGVSQERLATDLGLTFQQVQKYERGANRVSASKLYDIASALKIGIEFFFDGLPDPAAGAALGVAEAQTPFGYDLAVTSPEIIEMAQVLQRLPRRRRRLVRDLARELAALPVAADEQLDTEPGEARVTDT